MTATAPHKMPLMRSRNDAADLATLEPIAAKLAREIQGLLDSRAGNITVAAGAANAARYPEWRIAQNPFGALLRFKLWNGSDEALVHLPGHLISQIVDLHYGGCGNAPVRSEFTAAELRITSRLGDQMAALLGAFFDSAGTTPVKFAETHTDLLYASWPKAREAIIVQPFFAEGGAIKPSAISLIMAADTLRSLSKLSCVNSAQSAHGDAAWAERVRLAAMQICLPARTVLTRSNVPLQRLMTLAPGDVLPMLMPAQIPLTVAGRTFAHGSLGEANGRAALLIEKMETEMDQ